MPVHESIRGHNAFARTIASFAANHVHLINFRQFSVTVIAGCDRQLLFAGRFDHDKPAFAFGCQHAQLRGVNRSVCGSRHFDVGDDHMPSGEPPIKPQLPHAIRMAVDLGLAIELLFDDLKITGDLESGSIANCSGYGNFEVP